MANGIRWAEALFDVPYSPFVIHSSNSRLAHSPGRRGLAGAPSLLFARHPCLEPDRACQAKTCTRIRRLDLLHPCIDAARRISCDGRGGQEVLCAHGQSFSSARHRQSGRRAARKETASLSRPISRNAWRAAAKSRTTAPTTKKADVLSGPTGSGGGARPPRRRRGRCLAFHKVAKEARQLGPILKRRVRGILET